MRILTHAVLLAGPAPAQLFAEGVTMGHVIRQAENPAPAGPSIVDHFGFTVKGMPGTPPARRPVK